MSRILLIEDDPTIADGIIAGLGQHRMMVDWFSDAKLGEMAIHEGAFDAVLLDLTLPRGDGMTILANWRTAKIDTPVLIITARDAIANRVAGLNAGADDYLVKPFALDEVVARIQALIRRSQGRSDPEIRYGKVSFSPQTQQVSYDGQPVDLTVKEIAVLEHMLAPDSLAGAHIFFPDPWHKKRHNKRRLIQPAFVKLLVSRIRPGGYLHLATDWEDYAIQMLEVLSAEPALANTADGYAPRPDYRPLTKFENRGIKLGHGVWDLVFTRIA